MRMQNLSFALLQHFLDTFETSINTGERRNAKEDRNINKMDSTKYGNKIVEQNNFRQNNFEQNYFELKKTI